MSVAVLCPLEKIQTSKRVNRRAPKAPRPLRERSDAFWMRELALRALFIGLILSLPGPGLAVQVPAEPVALVSLTA